MIRECSDSDFDEIYEIINDAAQAYKGVIPDELWKDPFLSKDYLAAEISNGVQFIGFERSDRLVGVMGTQDFAEVTLIRHSYVRTSERRNGIGSKLIAQHLSKSTKPLLVGCLRAMTWAISFYEKHGFNLVTDSERDRLRRKYWTLSPEHVENSVVLADPDWLKMMRNSDVKQ